MSYDNQRRRFVDTIPKCPTRLSVDSSRRLIGNDKRRLATKCNGKHHSLRLSSADFKRIFFKQFFTVRYADFCKVIYRIHPFFFAIQLLPRARKRLVNLRFNFERRIERFRPALRHEGNFSAEKIFCFFAILKQIHPVKNHFARCIAIVCKRRSER